MCKQSLQCSHWIPNNHLYVRFALHNNCVLHKCHKCSVVNLQKCIMEGNSLLLRDTSRNVLIKQWVKKQWHRNDQKQTDLDWKHVNVSYIELLEMLFTLMENMTKHAFFASWNFTQFINCMRNLQQKEVIFIHDFAANYLCVHQDEPHALHLENQ